MPIFTKKPRNEKEYKNIRIYNILKEKMEMSRADLTAITNINAVSISNYVNAFLKKGLIVEREIGASSGGRPPILLELNNKTAFTIGVYMSEFYVKSVCVDMSVNEIKHFEKKISTKGAEEAVLESIRVVKEGIGSDCVKGIAVTLENQEVSIANIERNIESEFNTQIYTFSPAVSEAYLETLSRGAVPEDNFLYSYKDIGECVFFENQRFYTKDDDMEKCAYLRPWGDGMSVRAYAKKLAEQGGKTGSTDADKVSPDSITEENIFNTARNNDTAAIDILEFAGLNLGVRLAYLINIFNPKKLILGGGVQKSEEHFIEPVKRSIQKLALEEVFRKVNITYSGLENECAAATGAAALVIREVFMGV